MPDLKDNISLTLPTTIPSARRATIRSQWSSLLRILNGPDRDEKGRSLAEAKKQARRAMHQLRAEIAKMGGKMDIDITSAQTDPTTGEITTPGARPMEPSWSLGGADVQSTRSIQSAISPRALTAPTQAPLPGPPAPMTLPPTPTPLMEPDDPRHAMRKMAPPQTEKGSMAPDPVPASLEPSLTPPKAPAGPTETPEMQRLRALLAEEMAAVPEGELSLGQKIAFGLIAGIHGPKVAMEMAQGQKTEAVQRFLLQRREREALINNLTALVGLQQQDAARQSAMGAAGAEDLQKANDRANAFFQVASEVSATTATAEAISKELANDPSVAMQARGLDLANQRAALINQLNQLNDNIRANPRAMIGDDAPLRMLADANKRLADLTLAATTDLANRVKSDSLPDTVVKEMKALDSIVGSLDSAIRQVDELNAEGSDWMTLSLPYAADLYTSSGYLDRIGSLVAGGVFPERARAIGILHSTLGEPAQLIRLLGPGARISPQEEEYYGGFLFTMSDPLLKYKLEGTKAWVMAKRRMMSGDSAAQDDADKIRLRMEANRPLDGTDDPVIGQTTEGEAVWYINGRYNVMCEDPVNHKHSLSQILGQEEK